MNSYIFNRDQLATAIAILFHAIGLVGIFFFNKVFFIATTPINLLLMFALLVWTQKDKNIFFWTFVVAAFIIGFTAEIIGIHTHQLFGQYFYGDALGVKWQQVPLVIAVNWFSILYCCGIGTHTIFQRAIKIVSTETKQPPQSLKALSVIVDGAVLATIFDWVMEPVAIKLNFWQWPLLHIPTYNYVCWFVISAGILTIFHLCNFNKQNKFAIHLLLIQFMFFLILRTFL